MGAPKDRRPHGPEPKQGAVMDVVEALLAQQGR